MADKKTKPPSELFERVIRDAGSLVIDCGFCGRTHFATMDEAVFNEGELESLRANAKKEPDKYLEDASYDTIAWGYLNGLQAVIGCPCNKLREYEDLFWNNRRLILEYLERRAKAQLEVAKADAAQVQQAKSAQSGG